MHRPAFGRAVFFLEKEIFSRREGEAVLYFFTPEKLLPPDVGFSLFGPGHLAALGTLTALSALVIGLGCCLELEKRQRLLKAMAAVMLGMEVAKDVILGALGAFSVGYLPLHLCSMAMFICLYAAWHPDSDGAGQLLWCVCFTGGLAALLFPDWTRMPLWHFQSVHSFLYHAMLVQFSLIAVLTGQARPRLQKLWKVGLFLLLAAAAVYPCNRVLGTNYMFLNHPVLGTPLELCARLPGKWGYLVGYGILTGAVLVVLELPFLILERLPGRKANHNVEK